MSQYKNEDFGNLVTDLCNQLESIDTKEALKSNNTVFMKECHSQLLSAGYESNKAWEIVGGFDLEINNELDQDDVIHAARDMINSLLDLVNDVYKETEDEEFVEAISNQLNITLKY